MKKFSFVLTGSAVIGAAICLSLMAPLLVVASSESAFNSEAVFGKWVTYYYLKPEPEKVLDAVNYYCHTSLFLKPNSRLPMESFFAAILRSDNKLMNDIYEDISVNGTINAKAFLIKVLWLVNNAESNELIHKAIRQWRSEEINKQIKEVLDISIQDLYKNPITDPSQLDMLWTEFFATGDSLPVKRIISTLHLLKDGHGFDVAIGGAARWSLASNAIQHRKVYEICQEEARKSDKVTAMMLEEIVAKTDESK